MSLLAGLSRAQGHTKIDSTVFEIELRNVVNNDPSKTAGTALEFEQGLIGVIFPVVDGVQATCAGRKARG